jgi:hypothetical protein
MDIKTLIEELKYEFSKQCYRPRGFCECKNPIMIEDDGLRCVDCRKWVKVEIDRRK